MQLPLSTAEALLQAAVAKANKQIDRLHLLELPAIINRAIPDDLKPLGTRYIYDTLYLGIKKAKEKQEPFLALEEASLNTIAVYLGYKNIDAFRAKTEMVANQHSPALEGNWYSIVRCNSGRPDLLLSPVQIYRKQQEGFMKLRSPHRLFEGKVNWMTACITAQLQAEDGKLLYLTFKVGMAKKPTVLQGVFSGISSNGDPIAGRELLFREDNLAFAKMENSKISIPEALATDDAFLPKQILLYFRDFHKNYLKIANTSTFDLQDLEDDQ